MPSYGPQAMVKEMGGVERKREFCRMSASLKEAYQRYNHWQYRDARKGRSADHWKKHAGKVKELVEGTVKNLRGNEHAVVLGAGFCFEVPLRFICERFSKVTLVDVDMKLMEEAVSRLNSAELANRVHLLEGDVSLFINNVVAQVEAVLQNHPPGMPRHAARSIILSLLDSATQGNATSTLLRIEDNSADFIFSSDVLSYMLPMPVSWIDVSYEKKFGISLGLEERPENSKLLYATVESHLHEAMRILRPDGQALFETCIAHAPIVEDNVLIGVEDPFNGSFTYMGIPSFGYNLVARKMVELPHLIYNLAPRDITLVISKSFVDWTVQISPLQLLMTPVGPVPAYYGNVFQAVTLEKRGSNRPDNSCG